MPINPFKFIPVNFDVAGCKIKFKYVFIKYCCHFLLTFTILFMQIQHANATYFVAGAVSDHMVIAIDSRATVRQTSGVGTTFNDRYCKIALLSESVVFFDTGATAYKSDDGLFAFDARDIAANVFHDSYGVEPEKIAVNWANRMSTVLFPILNSLPLSDLAVRGFFAGHGTEPHLFLRGARVVRGILGLTVQPEDIVIGNDGSDLINNGHVEILQEFVNGGTTERARKLWQEAEARSAGRDPVEGMAIHFETYVKAVRDWSGEPGIGGDIAVVMMRHDQQWRWFYRPDFCPEK